MVEITNDALDIVRELRRINPGYCVFYNGEKRQYELYLKEYGRVSYQLAFPYDALDMRAVIHCRRTLVARKDALLEELEKENAALERAQRSQSIKYAENRTEELLSSGGTR